MTKKQKKVLWRIIATAVIILVIKLFSIGGIAGTLLYLAAYGIIGYDIRNPRKWQPDTLARLLDTHLASENLHALPYRLTLTDSLGTLLSQYSNTKQQITSPEISLVFPLGYLEKHLLKAEFNLSLIHISEPTRP